MYLCLDLSLSSTGFAVFNDNGALQNKGKIVPESELENCFKNHYVIEQLKPLYHKVNTVVIEDIYLGPCGVQNLILLGKLQGAIVESWLSMKFIAPVFYPAVTARSLVEVSPRSHKSEIQIWVLERFSDCTKKQITNYKQSVEQLKKEYTKRTQFRYYADKLSLQIEKETGFGNDLSDAILLGKAYYKDKLQGEK